MTTSDTPSEHRSESSPATERPIGQARGTRDWLPSDYQALASLEALLLDRFGRAGYAPMRTPVLEITELHERKSGAGIVAKLFGVANGDANRLCLRPELTASIVRAYTAAPDAPPLPWRVCMSAPVFRYEKTPGEGQFREFQQVGVELLGASGADADAEVIWLADWTLREAGIHEATIRIGHVGLILEMLKGSGLPTPAQAALVEMLSEAAAEGATIQSLEHGLEGLTQWLRSSETDEAPLPVGATDLAGVDRLFQTLVPVVTGRRSGHEILGRLRRKWELSHSLLGVLDDVRQRVHDLAGVQGSAVSVLDRLNRDYKSVAPESVAALRDLVATLETYGIDLDRVRLDLGFSRGIGFYSQMVFELVAPTPGGPVEVCGGGRYDGLARVLGSDRDDRGVGFAFGLERLWQALAALGKVNGAATEPVNVVVTSSPGQAGNPAVGVAVALRAEGVRVVLETNRNVKELITSANSRGISRVIEVGVDPMIVFLHDPAAQTRSKVAVSDLPGLLKKDRGR